MVGRGDVTPLGGLVEPRVPIGLQAGREHLQGGATVIGGEGGEVAARIGAEGVRLRKRQCKAADAQHDGLARLDVMQVQQPAGPPENKGLHAGVHLAGLETEIVAVAEMVFVHFDDDRRVAAENPTVVKLLGECAVEREISDLGKGEGEMHAGAVAELAPFPGTVAELGVADHGAAIEDLDLAGRSAAGDQTGCAHDVDEAARALGWQRLFGLVPEGVSRRKQERGKALGRPVGRRGAGINLGNAVEAIRETQIQTALVLVNRARKKEVEVACAEPAQQAGGELGAVLREGKAEDVEAVEAIANRATERRVLAAGGEEVLVVANEEPRPVAPALCTVAIARAVQVHPHQAVKVKRVGVVVIEGLVDAVLEPAAPAVHRLELIEMRGDNGPIGAVRVAVRPEEFEDVHGHEEMVVVDDAAATTGREPAGDVVLFGAGERRPEIAPGNLQCDGEQAHLHVMLVVAGVGPPVAG